FASQLWGVIPDICTMAKALTNGSIPMGAVACRDEIYETVTDASPEHAIEFFHGYTYSAHPAACAAGNAALDIYASEGLMDRAREMAPYFDEAMMSLRDHALVKDIRNIGMMSGLEVHAGEKPGMRGQEMQKALFWNGAHVKFTGDVAIVAPAFIAERAHIDEIVDKLRITLDQFAA
ncbi:MAG: aminotransferase class III-fold pyridoxal phosphate-dependent enzyme, partial [Pseudomonadota bacterium]